jgi:hypothetical protein
MKIKISKIDFWSIFAPIPVLALLTIFGIIPMWEGTVIGYLTYLAIYYFIMRKML